MVKISELLPFQRHDPEWREAMHTIQELLNLPTTDNTGSINNPDIKDADRPQYAKILGDAATKAYEDAADKIHDAFDLSKTHPQGSVEYFVETQPLDEEYRKFTRRLLISQFAALQLENNSPGYGSDEYRELYRASGKATPDHLSNIIRTWQLVKQRIHDQASSQAPPIIPK